MLFLFLAISIRRSLGGGEVNILSDNFSTANRMSSASTDFLLAYVE